ncbi:sam domain and hd domain-containing protein 1 [Moniliophthora roreri]|uniref:HD domain-containing protein n=1 Tax=Moniliophthora roreri TaxID=221103 RepID=A0A0W0GAX6_MONRR|nr:sam domain and hd domain-containing protein 1 [Moniliophthora roreri]
MEATSLTENPFFNNEEQDYVEESESVNFTVSQRQLKDPIHDLIELSPRLCQFIDTKQFQRLRDIKQLGTTQYVWPAASHSRFEHCIGVAHLARKLVENLQRSQPELNITDRDIELVEIAGLCHDLGHGPWSHVWDGQFIPSVKPDSTWTHEQGSEMMLDYLIQENGIDISLEDVNFIKDLIAGEKRRCSPGEKSFLFEIVANKRNGLDVDKFDYIQRDSHLLGDPTKINVNRILQSARVIEDQICYHIKDLPQIKEIYRTRFKLHELYYNHKTAKIIEYMILDALKAVNEHSKIADKIHSKEAFCSLTDNIMHEIKISKEPELKRAQAIFRRIEKRDLYKVVEWKLVKYQYRAAVERAITASRIVEAAKAAYSPDVSPQIDITKLKDDDVIVEFTTLHHGMKERNPLDFVKFYSKMNPNKCRNAQPGDYSTVMPTTFAEVLMRVYTKESKYHYIVQAGYRSVLESFRQAQSPPTSAEAAQIATPPATEAPTSPRTTSFYNPSDNASPPDANTNKRTNSMVTSFSANEFTTVTPNYGLATPHGVGRSPGRQRTTSARKRDVQGLRDRSTSPSDGRGKSAGSGAVALLSLPAKDLSALGADGNPPVKKRKVDDAEPGLLEPVILDKGSSDGAHATGSESIIGG